MTTAAEAQTKKKPDGRKIKGNIVNALITMLPVVGFFVFGAFPMVASLVMSFFKITDPDVFGVNTEEKPEFVGFQNFIDMLDYNKIGQSFLYSFASVGLYVLNVFIGLVIAVFVAYQLNKITFLRRLFRTIFFIPVVCSVSVVTIVFKMFLDANTGVFNTVLTTLHFEPVRWITSSPVLFNVSMILVSVWSGLGYAVVLLQAAFASVDESYAEAAAIDGANSWQIFWKITFHAITPTLGYLLTMRLIAAMQQMGLYFQFGHSALNTAEWLREGNNVFYAWETPVVYIYEMAFGNKLTTHGFGMASAAAWILALIIFIITRINLKLQEKWVSYDF